MGRKDKITEGGNGTLWKIWPWGKFSTLSWMAVILLRWHNCINRNNIWARGSCFEYHWKRSRSSVSVTSDQSLCRMSPRKRSDIGTDRHNQHTDASSLQASGMPRNRWVSVHAHSNQVPEADDESIPGPALCFSPSKTTTTTTNTSPPTTSQQP